MPNDGTDSDHRSSPFNPHKDYGWNVKLFPVYLSVCVFQVTVHFCFLPNHFRVLFGEFNLFVRVCTHSSILAWRISQAAEPGGLQSTGLQRDTTKSDLTRMHALMLSHFSRVWLFEILWTIAHQASLSMGFSRQEYWSQLPCPPLGDLPDPGIDPASLSLLHWQAGSLPLAPPQFI